jgi:hypothetical protein
VCAALTLHSGNKNTVKVFTVAMALGELRERHMLPHCFAIADPPQNSKNAAKRLNGVTARWVSRDPTLFPRQRAVILQCTVLPPRNIIALGRNSAISFWYAG